MTEAEARRAIEADVSRETLDRLEVYHRLLLKWQRTVNLISPATADVVWHRHFLDSLQLLDAVDPASQRWVDLGSGGGFPGLVCAIALASHADGPAIELIESDTRKCAFLREVSRETGVPVVIRNARAEAVEPREADVVTARALAPLPKLLPIVHRHLAPDGIALLQKGARHAEELALARRHWQMEVDVLPSVTASDAVILRLRTLTHA